MVSTHVDIGETQKGDQQSVHQLFQVFRDVSRPGTAPCAIFDVDIDSQLVGIESSIKKYPR